MAKVLQLWYFKEGNRAHEKQSAALIEAIVAQRECNIHIVECSQLNFGIRVPSSLQVLPSPDLLIGAGHGTHWPMVRCKIAFGGHSVVIMKPSLPLSWFDSAIIPRHDTPKPQAKTFISQGMLNPAFKSQPDLQQGVILLGGINKYFAWQEALLIKQINAITSAKPDCQWQISNSRRTPDDFNVEAISAANVRWVNWQDEGPQWLPRQLAQASSIWVSCDSMSMIYEALNSAAQVGVLQLPVLKQANKMSREVERLIEHKQVLTQAGIAPSNQLRSPLNEHFRAAQWLLARL